MDKSIDKAAAQPSAVHDRFQKRRACSINGENGSPAQLVLKMNTIAGNHGIGRIDMMEDRMMGLKVRENYECPGATVFLKAHKALENLVLTRDEIRFKALVDQEWSSWPTKVCGGIHSKTDLEALSVRLKSA